MATQHNFRIKNGLEVAGTERISSSGVITGSLTGSLASATTATTQSASDNSTKIATTAYTDAAITALVDSSPGALNTLNELAAALGDDANFSTTVTNSIATKAPLAGPTFTGTITGPHIVSTSNTATQFKNATDTDIQHKLETNAGSDFAIHRLIGSDGVDNKFIIGYGPNHPSTPNHIALKSTHASGSIGFSTGASSIERMHITSAGKVGIGTTSPANYTYGDLVIDGTGASAGISLVSTTSSYGGIFFADGTSGSEKYRGFLQYNHNYSGLTDKLLFGSGGATNMVLDGSGKLGIGTDDPDYSLHVKGAGHQRIKVEKTDAGGDSDISIAGPSDSNGWILFTDSTSGNNSGVIKYVHTGDYMSFRTNGTDDRIRITSDGRIGINNTGAAWVDANDKFITNGRGVFRGYGHSPLALGRYNSGASAGEAGGIIDFLYGGAGVGSVSITTNSTQYNTTSDIRLKENIQTIVDGSSKIMAMNPVSHTWKDNQTEDAVHGFIAQEMKDIVPESVTGEPEGEEMMQMDYGRITPVIVAGLQDALKEIKELKNRIHELENR